MAATYKPIAGLSPDDHGPINTIVSVFLIVTSLLFSSVRYAIGRKKLLQLDIDDGIFALALVLAVVMSVLSQQMVRVGLGRHEDALTPEQLEEFYKFQYATQFLAVLSMTCAKMSIVFMFRRIIPTPRAPYIMKILMPTIFVYTISAFFLIAFQCQLPRPWVLIPASCSTHGTVYYATTALNMLTDAVLALWILPAIWALQMDRGSKAVVIALFASRILVCAADSGRMYVIHRSLQHQDTTWGALGWAIGDQAIVHLSLNHATLPRIHVFLRNLQTGLLVTRLTTGNALTSNSKGSKPKSDHEDSIPLSSTTPSSTSRQKGRNGFRNPFRSGNSRQTVSICRDAHSSKAELRLQPDQGNELSTFVSTGDGESTSSGGDGKGRGKGRKKLDNGWGQYNVDEIYESPHDPQQAQIKVQKTLEIKTELAKGR